MGNMGFNLASKHSDFEYDHYVKSSDDLKNAWQLHLHSPIRNNSVLFN